MKRLFFSFLLAFGLGALAGCAGTPNAGGSDAGATSSSGITVFGVVDASVSHTRNR